MGSSSKAPHHKGFSSLWLWPFRLAAAATTALLLLHLLALTSTHNSGNSASLLVGQELLSKQQQQQQQQQASQQQQMPQQVSQQQQQPNPAPRQSPEDSDSMPQQPNQQQQQDSRQQPTEQLAAPSRLQPQQPELTEQQRQQQQQQERRQQMLQTQQKVYKCLTDAMPDIDNTIPATYQAHKDASELAKLIPVRLWQSTKPQPQQTLTVVTALSRPRLGMLEAQCKSWPGPLTTVLYEPTVAASSAGSATADATTEGSGSDSSRDSSGDSSGGSETLTAGSSLENPEEEAFDAAAAEAGSAAIRKLFGASSSSSSMSAGSGNDGLGGQGGHGKVLLQEYYKQDGAAQKRMADTDRAVQDMFQRMEGLGSKACSLSVLLVTELVDASLEQHPPINSMRNQAVLMAQTPLVAMLDADLVVSQSLAQSLEDPTDAEALVELVRGRDDVGRRLVVLPAFETLPHKSKGNAAEDELSHRVADFAQVADKQALQGLMRAGLLGPFNKVVNPPGHAETDFHRWLAFQPNHTTQGVTYAIKPQHEKFEPWYIMDRQAALQYPYDEVFRGYGKNKIAHRLWMSSLRFEFLVHGSAFIVHRVHAESDAKLAWRAQFSSQRGGPLNTARLDGLLPQMQQQTYQPSLGSATGQCIQEARQRHEAWRQQQLLELQGQQHQHQRLLAALPLTAGAENSWL